MSDAGPQSSISPGGTPPSRRPSNAASSDEAVAQVLEAVIIGFLVLAAIGFAIAFESSPSPSASSGTQNLEERTWDAVDALNRLSYPNESYGNSTLSKVVANAIEGNPDPLQDTMKRFMPPGSQFHVYLNNGYDRTPLYTNTTPPGQTIGISYPFEPHWNNHYGATDLRLYDDDANIGLGLTLSPLFRSSHVQDEGHDLRVRASGQQPWLPGDVRGSNLPLTTVDFHEDAYTTLVQGDDTVDYPSASIYLACNREGSLLNPNPPPVPCYGMDFTDEMNGYQPQASQGNAHRLDLVVDNAGPGPIPTDTELTLRLPTGVGITRNVTSPDGAFTEIRYIGEKPQPETIKATVDTGGISAGSTGELHVWVHANDTRYAYKQLDAHLAKGAVSHSQFLLVVADKASGTYTGADTRRALISTPKPAGSLEAGAEPTSRWGVVIPSPYESVDVEQIALTLTEGDGAWSGVSFPNDFDPTYTGDGFTTVKAGSLGYNRSEITWNGSFDGGAYEFIELQFEATTTGELTPASARFPLAAPSPSFTAYTPPPQATQVEPGLWWREHTPETNQYAGYGADVAAPSEGEPIRSGTIEQRLTHRNEELAGNTTYRIAGLTDAGQGALKDAVDASRLTIQEQRVQPGSTVHMEIKASDLSTYLGGVLGLAGMDLETHIYAPWGVNTLTPIETIEHNDPSDALDGTFAFEYDLPRGALYGTYLAVTEAKWEILDTWDTAHLQTAKMHNTFVVTPPNGEIPLSPTYNLEVVAWLEDWQ